MSVNRFGDILKGDPGAVGGDGAAEAFAQSGHMDVDGWIARYIGKGIWDLMPTAGAVPGKILMTGAAVTMDCKVPLGHRLVRFEWKHLDAALADSVVATEAIMSRIDYEPVPLLWRIYYEAASVSATTVVPFGEGYEYLACTYRLSFNTTADHMIAPRLWLQEIKP